MADRQTKFFKICETIIDRQFGFQANWSTVDVILSLLHYISNGIEEKKKSITILCDVRKVLTA